MCGLGCPRATLTHANHPLNVNVADINLLGEFVDGLIGVLIGERIHVDFDSCRGGGGRRVRAREKKDA